MSAVTLFIAAVIGAAVLVLAWTLSRRKKPKPWIQATVCPKCGWQGQASSYAGRCPRCNTPVGDQKAKRGE